MNDAKTLAELADASGIPARTIRFYIARGLMDGPVKAGRGAVYGAGHLARLERIKSLQAEGRMLVEIGRILEDATPAETGAPPAAWWQHVVEEDVMVWVRADVSPWRMKQIRSAIDELASQVRPEKSGKVRSTRK